MKASRTDSEPLPTHPAGPRLSSACLQGLVFLVAWLIIIAVSAYDNYETVRNREVMAEVEINPVALLLIESNREGVALLVAMKTLGAALALLSSILIWNSVKLRRAALVASCVVACFQMGLLGYLRTDFIGNRVRELDQFSRSSQVAGDKVIERKREYAKQDSSGEQARHEDLSKAQGSRV